MYADIALETAALSTANNVTILVTDVLAKCAPMICSISNSDESPIFLFFHTDRYSAQPLMH
jgi:hypothetical protein